MFFLLSKLLHFLTMPLTWVAALLLLSVIMRKRALKLRGAALITLLVFSNSFLLHEVQRLWEIPVTLEGEIEHCTVGVVLTGFASHDPEKERITFRNNSDRIMQGIWLLKQGHIDKLMISGGSGYLMRPGMREAKYVGDYLRDIGIGEAQLIIEKDSKNTHENAAFTAARLENLQLNRQRLTLITSARHMRRSIACFEAQGLSVQPFATDPNAGKRIYYFDHLLIPSATTLQSWNGLIHEWVGFVGYWFAGYV